MPEHVVPEHGAVHLGDDRYAVLDLTGDFTPSTPVPDLGVVQPDERRVGRVRQWCRVDRTSPVGEFAWVGLGGGGSWREPGLVPAPELAGQVFGRAGAPAAGGIRVGLAG